MLRVGLVGCGTIGSRVARTVEQRHRARARIVGLHDSNPRQAQSLQRRLRSRPPILSLAELIRRSDLVVEAASVVVAAEVARRCLRAHRDVIVMSSGGLLLDRTWRRAAARSRGRVFLPSGALAGLDGVRAMGMGRIREVSLITSKPPRALETAPYVKRRGLTLGRLRRARVIFRGHAGSVVRAFPQNTNVAATLALASGLPPRRVRVQVVADPSLRRNVHELRVVGDSGSLQCRIESRPSANPKTSELAVQSAAAALERLFGRIIIGT